MSKFNVERKAKIVRKRGAAPYGPGLYKAGQSEILKYDNTNLRPEKHLKLELAELNEDTERNMGTLTSDAHSFMQSLFV